MFLFTDTRPLVKPTLMVCFLVRSRKHNRANFIPYLWPKIVQHKPPKLFTNPGKTPQKHRREFTKWEKKERKFVKLFHYELVANDKHLECLVLLENLVSKKCTLCLNPSSPSCQCFCAAMSCTTWVGTNRGKIEAKFIPYVTQALKSYYVMLVYIILCVSVMVLWGRSMK